MSMTADEMIAALNGFEPIDDYDSNQFELYPVTEGFRDLSDKSRVVQAMFALMERFPDAYLGTPGPLVHCTESLGIDAYKPQLIESVRRQPSELSVWMINRILNVTLDADLRKPLLDLLRSVPSHPSAPARVAQSALEFLQHQAKRTPCRL